MTTYFPFNLSPIAAPTFQPTLDGQVCTIYVKWNLFGQRLYAECHDGDDDLVFNTAIVESPEAIPLSSLSYNELNLTVTATTVSPHNIPIGSNSKFTIEGANPSIYDDEFIMLSTGDDTLTFSLGTTPGATVVPGQLSFLISLTAGYFNSTLAYRNGQFEVSP